MKTLTANKKGLLPNYFKKIGIAIVILAIIIPIIIRLSLPELHSHKALIKLLAMNIIILGLFFIAWSRDKIEDEMTLHIRFMSMVRAFVFGIILVILQPLVDVVFSEPIAEISSQQLIATMLLFFIFTYAVQKKAN